MHLFTSFMNWPALRWPRATWLRFKGHFPERQLFIRSRGKVHFLNFSYRKQMAILAVATVPLAIVLAGAFGLALQQSWVAARDHRIAELLQTKERLTAEKVLLVGELMRSRKDYSLVTRRIEEKHSALDEMQQARTSLEQWVSQLRGDLETLEAERRRRRDELSAELRRRQAELAAERRLRLSQLSNERARRYADNAALIQRFEHLREQLTRATYLRDEPKGSLVSVPRLMRLSYGSGFEANSVDVPAAERPAIALEFEATNRLLALTAAERDNARRLSRNLEVRSKHLENRLTDLQEMQNSLIARIENGTEAHIGELEKVIKLTGLDVEGLLDRMGDTAEGIGGPLVGIAAPEGMSELAPTPLSHPDSTDTLEDRFSNAINRMGAKLARWSALNNVAERLPLAAPVTPYKLSSRFGKRRDPFTKRWAQHEGVDLSAPRRSPVLATAPGRVSFVGWKGAYGRMIEIDHGYGLKTRYGHLYRTYVKKGDQVIKQERIAVIGSSGRSTGRHLHYEVRFDGQPLDPKTFLKAGDHVFKDGQK
ncbi:MAG: peptidoglycan DD-metalloendopeptidase family protein [Alphaproteobacteria bacterium]|nr:peptidoglycan DD-metalloendopeptidase family protein [Alphaproteobacteria bacterium]